MGIKSVGYLISLIRGDFVGDFLSMKINTLEILTVHVYSMHVYVKNEKFNPLKIKKLRAFYKNTKFYTLEILYLYGSLMILLMYNFS